MKVRDYSEVSIEDESSNQQKSKPRIPLNRIGGCIVRFDDIPSVIATIACCLAFTVYGACACSLGAALPALSAHFKESTVKFGFAFTARGIGYCFGTISSAALMEVPSALQGYKPQFVCFSVLIIGIFIGLVPFTETIRTGLVLFWLQGYGYGMLDTFANCLLPELWGKRVGPWMQAMHCCFGLGAVIGPYMIGKQGYRQTFFQLAISSIIPSFFMAIYLIIGLFVTSDQNVDRAVLTIADEDDTDDVKQDSDPIPWLVRILISVFFFIYVGTETGFGGWVTTYALSLGITTSEEHAAYLVSYFWASLAFGRLVAIFLAIIVSNKTMIRVQLVLCVLSSVLLILWGSSSYSTALVASSCFGYALSSIFPLAMTMVNDYQFVMDPQTTTLFVLGATFGEALIPIFVGYVTQTVSVNLFPLLMLLLSVVLVVLYSYTHFTCEAYQRDFFTKKSLDSDKSISGTESMSTLQQDLESESGFSSYEDDIEMTHKFVKK